VAPISASSSSASTPPTGSDNSANRAQRAFLPCSQDSLSLDNNPPPYQQSFISKLKADWMRSTNDTQWVEGETVLQNLALVDDFTDSSGKQARRKLNTPFHKNETPPVGLYRGALPLTEADYAKLGKRYQVKIVIDLCSSSTTAWSQKAAGKAGIHVVSVPLNSKIAPTEKEFQIVRDTIAEAKKNGDSVYIHCRHGVDRTGVMVTDHEVNSMGHSKDEAFKAMQSHGYNLWHRLRMNAMETYLLGRPCWDGWKEDPSIFKRIGAYILKILAKIISYW
jgi:protein tyrosine phosphatase (PTP) superfamily phosphohydrolase (DUF442 family)